MADNDVLPLPLTDEDDFFSDLGSDEPYLGGSAVGTGSRLVIDVEGPDTNSSQLNVTPVNSTSRTNPFSTTEPRARNLNFNHDDHENNSHSLPATGTTRVEHGKVIDGYSHSSSHGHAALGNQSQSDSALGSVWDHCHVPANPENNTVRNQLIAISIFTTLFGIGETVGAIKSESIAIGTDVMHLASDLLSFIISLIAVSLAKKAPTPRFPWGFHRAEVLGALLSVFVIWVVTGILVYLAVERVITQEYDSLDPDVMLYTSVAGVVFNIVMAVVLNADIFKCQVSHGHSHDGAGHGHSHGSGHGHSHHLPLSRTSRDDRDELTQHTDDEVDEAAEASSDSSGRGKKKETNIVIRAAFVHVLGDLIQSVGVFISALVIKFTEYRVADPICTFTFSVLVLITTITVLRDAFFMLMEGCPKKISYDYLHSRLSELPGVKAVHSLKIWALTATEVNGSVHLAVGESVVSPCELVKKATAILREGDTVTRTSVQVERYHEIYMLHCLECRHPGPRVNTNVDII